MDVYYEVTCKFSLNGMEFEFCGGLDAMRIPDGVDDITEQKLEIIQGALEEACNVLWQELVDRLYGKDSVEIEECVIELDASSRQRLEEYMERVREEQKYEY